MRVGLSRRPAFLHAGISAMRRFDRVPVQGLVFLSSPKQKASNSSEDEEEDND